ncbi:MAG TPA: hypothetical protein VF691_22740 [Cytophagaceae bacterium]|jgi:hypothetical protein
MSTQLLLDEKSISISYDHNRNWLIVDWKGFQTVELIKFGGAKMHEYLVKYSCQKVLNDNTNVTGLWSGAAEWTGTVWFPLMVRSGLKYFAWVYSPSIFSKLSTEESLENFSDKTIVKTFDDINSASSWLSECL